jgi:diguanylate cyclase (GGDEF)-like protein/PAS domain S-box-containing protein
MDIEDKTKEQLIKEIEHLRKQMDEELNTTNRQMELVLGYTKTGLDIIDSKFNIRYIDSEWQKVYGDPKGKKCYEYFMGRKEVCPACGIQKAFETKKPVVTEEVLARENNRPVQVTTVPFQDQNGEWLVAEVNVDITERKRLENTLKESETRFKVIFNESTDGMLLADVETKRFTMCNPRICKMLGYSEEEMMRLGVNDIHPKNDLPFVIEQFRKQAEGEIELVTLPVKRKDSSVFYADVNSTPIILDGKKYLIGSFRDVTNRKQVEDKLKTYQDHLEELVEKRTYELEMVNKKIQQDVVMCNRMSEELQKSEKRYRNLWDDAPVSYHTLDTQGIITNVNKTEAKMLGYKPKEMIGKSIFNFVLPEQQEEAKKRFQDKLSGKHLLKAERRIYVKNDGSNLYVSIDDMLEYDNDGKITGIKTTMVDVTESKKMEEALRESELQYKTTINSMRDAIHVVDADLRIVFCNNALQKWLEDIGIKTNITGKILLDVIPFLSDKVRNEYRQVFESKETLTTEEHINFMGKEFVTEVRKIPIEENNNIVRVLTIIRDITDRRKTEETIRHLAYHDILTNLPNRTLFNNRLALELNRAQRNKQKVSVILMDLDRFKKINDILGHSFGDQLLQDVGKRLLEIVRSSDTVARMGGDEFILLLPETPRIKDVTKIAKKILEAIKKPFLISGKELEITTSIGISIYPTHGEDAETLIKNADIAMYRAKKAGRNKFFRYRVDSK